MSEFHPQIVKILNILNHENADNLEIAIVLGDYPVIIKKGQFKTGDLCSYICIDAMLDITRPEFSFLDKPRIRAKKLRGVYSQGLLIEAPPGFNEGDSVIDHFGIKKFAYPEEMEDILGMSEEERKKYYLPKIDAQFLAKIRGGHQCSPPKGWSPVYYDLEALRKYSRAFQEGEEVVITEKIDGCVSGNTIISTVEFGDIDISTIVKNKKQCHVKSFNQLLGEIEFCEITSYSELENNNDWYEIETESGDIINITGDHYVWLSKEQCYRQVKDLINNDLVLIDN